MKSLLIRYVAKHSYIKSTMLRRHKDPAGSNKEMLVLNTMQYMYIYTTASKIVRVCIPLPDGACSRCAPPSACGLPSNVVPLPRDPPWRGAPIPWGGPSSCTRSRDTEQAYTFWEELHMYLCQLTKLLCRNIGLAMRFAATNADLPCTNSPIHVCEWAPDRGRWTYSPRRCFGIHRGGWVSWLRPRPIYPAREAKNMRLCRKFFNVRAHSGFRISNRWIFSVNRRQYSYLHVGHFLWESLLRHLTQIMWPLAHL